jgi:hypothetical protein
MSQENGCPEHESGPGEGAASLAQKTGSAYLNWKSAVWTLPSFSLSVKVPHFPLQLLLVFQT